MIPSTWLGRHRGARAHHRMSPASGVAAAMGMEPLGKDAGFSWADIQSDGLEYTCNII